VCHLMDDESQPDEVRDKAALMQYWLSEVLCYQDHSAEGERSLRLVPVGFKWPQFYTQMVDELVLDLYGSVEPTDIRSVRIMLARQAAAIVDDMLYSTDFRLEAYEVLNEILDSTRQSADEERAGDDEIERIILRYTMIRTGTEVRNHHEPPHAHLRGRIDHPDRAVAVDGIGSRRIAATGSGREDDRVVAGQQISQRFTVEPLDIGHHRLGTGGHDIVEVVGITEDRTYLVATFGEDARQLQCDLAVTADDDDACHTNRRYCP
jgi:hypothetical protein